MARITLTARILPGGHAFTVKSREAMTLLAQIDAGARGMTSLECHRAGWTYRLAAYVCDLKKLGVPIRMEREPHDDGQHGRYFLAGRAEIVNTPVEQERAAA